MDAIYRRWRESLKPTGFGALSTDQKLKKIREELTQETYDELNAVAEDMNLDLDDVLKNSPRISNSLQAMKNILDATMKMRREAKDGPPATFPPPPSASAPSAASASAPSAASASAAPSSRRQRVGEAPVSYGKVMTEAQARTAMDTLARRQLGAPASAPRSVGEHPAGRPPTVLFEDEEFDVGDEVPSDLDFDGRGRYTLRKAPKRPAFWVVDETGRHYSTNPLPKERARAQQRALYARENALRKRVERSKDFRGGRRCRCGAYFGEGE